jgi:hypothetical protein
VFDFFGERGGARTHDPVIKSHRRGPGQGGHYGAGDRALSQFISSLRGLAEASYRVLTQAIAPKRWQAHLSSYGSETR